NRGLRARLAYHQIGRERQVRAMLLDRRDRLNHDRTSRAADWNFAGAQLGEPSRRGSGVRTHRGGRVTAVAVSGAEWVPSGESEWPSTGQVPNGSLGKANGRRLVRCRMGPFWGKMVSICP